MLKLEYIENTLRTLKGIKRYFETGNEEIFRIIETKHIAVFKEELPIYSALGITLSIPADAFCRYDLPFLYIQILQIEKLKPNIDKIIQTVEDMIRIINNDLTKSSAYINMSEKCLINAEDNFNYGIKKLKEISGRLD